MERAGVVDALGLLPCPDCDAPKPGARGPKLTSARELALKALWDCRRERLGPYGQLDELDERIDAAITALEKLE